MRYKILLTPRAKRQLRDITKKLHKEAVVLAIEEIKEDPYIGKKLQRELKNLYSYRVGVYRIVYRIFEKEKTIEIYTAGHRSVVYN